MGGFHGGHSSGGHSGGGFHGGHSSHSSYHSSHHSSYHSSSVTYVSRPTIVHTVRDGRHYLNGKRYYGAYYGVSGDRPRTFASYFSMGLVPFIIGLVIFFAFLRVGTTATVTDTYETYDQYHVKYEKYDFEYYFNGVRYSGYGDDDLDASGHFTILKGNHYEIYVNPINPSSYSFENNTAIGIIAFGILGSIGMFIMVRAVSIKRKHDKELAAVGDINKDGIINDADLAYAEALHQGEAHGAYEGTYQATKENEYLRNKVYRRCPHCDTILDDDAKFCPQCGSNLKE